MRQGQRQVDVLTQPDHEALRLSPVDRDVDRGLGHALGRGAHVLDPDGEGDGFAQDGKGGGVADDKAAIPILGLAGHQQMNRRGHVGGPVDVVQASVRHHDGAGDPGARFLGHRLGQGGHQLGAGVGLTIGNGDPAHLGVRAGRQTRGHAVDRRVGLGCAVRQGLAGRAVLDQQDDVRERRAVLLPVGRTRERGQYHQRGQPAQGPARQPAPDGQRHPDQAQRRQRNQKRPGQEGVEDHRSGHWPNLSSSAGTCTWSDL